MSSIYLYIILKFATGILLGCFIHYILVKGFLGNRKKQQYETWIKNINGIDLFQLIFAIYVLIFIVFNLIVEILIPWLFSPVQDMSKNNDNYDGKSSFIGMPPQSSGNSPYDLLNTLVYLEHVKIILIFILGLLFLINILNLDKLTAYLEKYLPIKVHKFIGWYIRTLKISINTYIIIFLLLLFVASLISLYGLGFLFDNMEKMCRIYLKYIKK
jgi:hypothetical protein